VAGGEVAAGLRTEGAAVTKDPLAGEVRLLGGLLGDTIAEQAGADRYRLVEATRRAMVARRAAPAGRAHARRAQPTDLADAEVVARAFAMFFQLVNLAEERQRVRTLRTR
jgi:phosphoenolpyruvate carboxylase